MARFLSTLLQFGVSMILFRQEVSEEMKQTTCSGEETDSALPYWRIVCVELGIDLVGKNLVQLRRDAKEKVDEQGDRHRDYRFQTYLGGTSQGTIVITSTQGLRDFQHGRVRRAD
jgi:hypothetical protein